MAPDLVSSLRSLTDKVKTLQVNVRTGFDKTAGGGGEETSRRRSSARTLSQMKRVLHDIGRHPRRRRTKGADET